MKKLALLLMCLVSLCFAAPASATCPDPVISGSVGNTGSPFTGYIVRIQGLGSQIMVSFWTQATNTTTHYYLGVSTPAPPNAPTTFSGLWQTSAGTPIMTSFSGSALPPSDGAIWINGAHYLTIDNGMMLGQSQFNGGITGLSGNGGAAQFNIKGLHNGVPKQVNLNLVGGCEQLSSKARDGEPLLSGFFAAPPKHPDALAIESLLFR